MFGNGPALNVKVPLTSMTKGLGELTATEDGRWNVVRIRLVVFVVGLTGEFKRSTYSK